MLILLPPSESKAARRRGVPMDLATLTAPELTGPRRHVIDRLGALSTRHDAAAVLGVSASLVQELARNGRLESAPALRAAELYTGVLYDALDLDTLGPPARRRASRRLAVVSALYGAVRMTDRVAPYRLSMAVDLPGVGPLVRHWREPLAQVLPGWAGRGLVVDCRSSTYAAAWRPRGDLALRWVQVRVPGATHLAKHTRGLVARTLCQVGEDPRDPQRLVELLCDGFQVDLSEPRSATAPWTLDATARPG